MAKSGRASSLASIFDEPEDEHPTPTPEPAVAAQNSVAERAGAGEGALPRRTGQKRATPQSHAIAAPSASPASAPRNHGTKKPVLVHIPADMHRTLRQLSVEEGGEPLTVVVERGLATYLAAKGHTKWLKGQS